MNYIVWIHDPCLEGGWHQAGQFNTLEEAVSMAEVLHASESKSVEEGFRCYDGIVITPGTVREWSLPNRKSVER